MELNELVDKLLKSGVAENEELGVTLLATDDMSPEERNRHILEFVERYTADSASYFTEEKRELFKGWIALYKETIRDHIKNNRVTKI